MQSHRGERLHAIARPPPRCGPRIPSYVPAVGGGAITRGIAVGHMQPHLSLLCEATLGPRLTEETGRLLFPFAPWVGKEVAAATFSANQEGVDGERQRGLCSPAWASSTARFDR